MVVKIVEVMVTEMRVALEKHLIVLDFKNNDALIDSLIVSTWIISDNWLNYIEFKKYEATSEKILEGYVMMLDIFRPYFTQPWDEVLSESLTAIKDAIDNK